jgi:hypothetical protein
MEVHPGDHLEEKALQGFNKLTFSHSFKKSPSGFYQESGFHRMNKKTIEEAIFLQSV